MTLFQSKSPTALLNCAYFPFEYNYTFLSFLTSLCLTNCSSTRIILWSLVPKCSPTDQSWTRELLPTSTMSFMYLSLVGTSIICCKKLSLTQFRNLSEPLDCATSLHQSMSRKLKSPTRITSCVPIRLIDSHTVSMYLSPAASVAVTNSD